MDFQLSDEQQLISETARDFADGVIAPRVKENDRAARFDRELASKLGEVGYLGAPVSEQYGGRGLDYLGYGLIVEQVGRADSSARTVVSVQTSLAIRSSRPGRPISACASSSTSCVRAAGSAALATPGRCRSSTLALR
jgi:alkylation response protein AidB-like acyl-CoA dehydrogenase